MPVTTLAKVRTQAFRLTPEQRIRLASDLFTSVPVEEKPLTWGDLDRRMDDAIKGENCQPVEVAMARARKKLGLPSRTF